MFVPFSIASEEVFLLFISSLRYPGIVIRIKKLRKCQSKQDYAEG
jgi:hypothetical protein